MCLVDFGLRHTGVDLKQQLPRFDQVSFAETDLLQDTAHLGSNRNTLIGLHRAHCIQARSGPLRL